MVVVIAVTLCSGCVVSNNPGTFQPNLCVGLGGGLSLLEPEALGNVSIEDNKSTAQTVTLGVDLSRTLALE